MRAFKTCVLRSVHVFYVRIDVEVCMACVNGACMYDELESAFGGLLE